MRTLMALTVALFVTGCGDDTSKTQMDMAMAVPDLSVGADMQKLSCAQILQCAAGNPAGALMCAANGSMTAQQKFGALSTCLIGQCIGDGGSCGATCQQCVQNAAIAAATNPSAPCHAQYVDCSMN